MPKARVEQEKSNDGKTAVVEMEVTQRDETKVTQYRKFLTFDALLETMSDAKGTPGLDFRTMFPITDRAADATDNEQSLWLRLVNSGLAAWARGDVYESLSAVSTIVSIGGKKYDLYEYKVPNFVKAYNGVQRHRQEQLDLLGADGTDTENDVVAGSDRKLNWNQYSATAAKHVEAGAASFQGDTLVAK